MDTGTASTQTACCLLHFTAVLAALIPNPAKHSRGRSSPRGGVAEMGTANAEADAPGQVSKTVVVPVGGTKPAATGGKDGKRPTTQGCGCLPEKIGFENEMVCGVVGLGLFLGFLISFHVLLFATRTDSECVAIDIAGAAPLH